MHYFLARSPLQGMAKIYWYLVNKFQNFLSILPSNLFIALLFTFMQQGLYERVFDKE